MGKAILFLYGSLKRGYSNHHRVAGQTYLGDAATAPHYRVILIGEYGGLVRDDGHGLAVTGEVWAVTPECLAELDTFETGEGLWARLPVEVPGHPHAEAYLWTGDVPADAISGDRWPISNSECGMRNAE